MTRLDDLLEQANPVATPPPGTVTPAQERLLSSLVATPPRRRRRGAIRLLVPASAVVAAAAALVLLFPRGEAANDETEATRPASAGEAAMIHVVTRLYGTVYGPGYGERLDGWLEPSTGRVRIVITTGDEMTLQQVVGADDHFQSWQGALGNAGGMTGDSFDRATAEHLRLEVRDRMTALIQGAKKGFHDDGTTFADPSEAPGEYHGRAVTIHRIAPVLKDGGAPSGYYFKWFSDGETGEVIAFERGPIVDGRDTVETGEELVKFETFRAGEAPLHELDWQRPPAIATPTMPPPDLSNTRKGGRVPRGATATPTPTPTATATATPKAP